MANDNVKLGKAKINKNDEFYTKLEDIEFELKHYKSSFKDKVVFCNCDDPFESNFFKYFALNFNTLGLKKLITTCYSGSPIITEQLSLFDVKGLEIKKEYEKSPYKIEITEVVDSNGDGAVDLSDVEYLLKNKKNTLTLLKGDGDFRSKECIELLKESDIVVTNPPFSLFREYVEQLIHYNKQFLIIGNQNALHYKNIFTLLQNNKIWLGYGFGSQTFLVPNDFSGKSTFVGTDGKKYAKFGNICWFTNLYVDKRFEKFISYKKYNPIEYPKFDNFDAINVNKVSDIPFDYNGIMGVPDSFLDKYNPDEFLILGRSGDTDWVLNDCDFFTPPSETLQKKYKKENNTWRVQNVYLLDKNGVPNIVYSRIFIIRKSGESQNGK